MGIYPQRTNVGSLAESDEGDKIPSGNIDASR